mmetsp:Transcript_7396/g.8987  ORF Transcript_7396/g.8987 Transcript_7396/m.8987 type:complete len:168 (-) Transcript_7396:209-712(-)|eukprot:jgi/Bigna1/87310/estExt_fgenesh1_pg.C_190028
MNQEELKSSYPRFSPKGTRSGTTLPQVSPNNASLMNGRPASRKPQARGVKRDIEKLWEVINQQQAVIERQHQEIERIQRMVEPMSDVLKRYTDQAERRMYKKMDKQSSDQIKTNTRIDNALAALRRAKANSDEKARIFTDQIQQLHSQLQFLNEEIFGDPAGGVPEE